MCDKIIRKVELKLRNEQIIFYSLLNNKGKGGDNILYILEGVQNGIQTYRGRVGSTVSELFPFIENTFHLKNKTNSN